MLPTDLARKLGGFSEDFLPCYCEDSDLCLRVQMAGYHVYYNPAATIIHHLSGTTEALDADFKVKSIAANLVKLQHMWADHLDRVSTPKLIAFYLPQFHPFTENERWWGAGFTEWTNVTKAQPNFVGHYQPRLPADLGFYDLRLAEVMEQQAELARRYGVHGFCYYYYWFGGKRLLERPIEQMLKSGSPDMPFCLCWANENWTRRWDGKDHEILMGQNYSTEDDIAVISDLIRFFRDPRYILVDGRPLILVYRASLFPDFAATVARWREACKEQGVGEIYVAMVEAMDLVHANRHPREFGCDAAVEFPPQEMAEQKAPSGAMINAKFVGGVADYRDIAVRYATRDFPGYTRFKGVMPGWDNTARNQHNSFCFEHSTPGVFQAWLEESIEQTRQQHYGDERMVFINAWNEWAEGAHLEPDRRFGHTYLEAVKNAIEASRLLRKNRYWHGK
jgi:lipopolysaccharide biosynthesis protein